MTATTRPEFRSVSEPTLYVAFELGKKEWKLAMTSGFGVDPWLRTVPGGDLRAVERAITQGRRRFSLPASAAVVSCDEAGRDGFWIHRAFTQMGVTNRVVDSASIEVNSHISATATKMALAMSAFTNASGMAATYITIDIFPLISHLTASARREPCPWCAMMAACRIVHATAHMTRSMPYTAVGT